jgi:hypothetical protein
MLMRLFRLPSSAFPVLSALTCAAPGARPLTAPPRAPECCLAEGLRVAETYRVPAITVRRFTHAELWAALDSVVRSPALSAEEVGRSLQGRAIRAVTFGRGETVVLLWSQMHGDESTATMALADIMRFFAAAEGNSLRERLAGALRVVMVPMLNPDGAELFQRENAAGIDVNRDARRLATPEARALKALRDRIRPAFGFNLHDQGARTLAGRAGPQAAIALLAPPSDEAGGYDATRARARLVAATIASVLARELAGRVAKYDDTFNPRAFGDLMQRWGTSTVLIESGALPGDPEKQRLRALNVVAILSALDGIATGSYAAVGPGPYDALPFNARVPYDVLVLGGHLVLDSASTLPADLALTYDDAVARTGARLRDVGDLAEAVAIDTVRAEGLFVHPAPASLTDSAGGRWLRLGAQVSLTIRKGASPASERVGQIGNGEAGIGKRE